MEKQGNGAPLVKGGFLIVTFVSTLTPDCAPSDGRSQEGQKEEAGVGREEGGPGRELGI